MRLHHHILLAGLLASSIHPARAQLQPASDPTDIAAIAAIDAAATALKQACTNLPPRGLLAMPINDGKAPLRFADAPRPQEELCLVANDPHSSSDLWAAGILGGALSAAGLALFGVTLGILRLLSNGVVIRLQRRWSNG